MKDTALFTQLLGLGDPWKITAITSDLTDKSITLQIDWPKGTKGACSVCHALCSVYDHREQRTWRHLDTMQFKTQLVAQVPRIHCKAHGIKSLKVPWADTQARFTHLFERFAIDVLSAASNKTQAAKLLGLSWDEVHHIQSRAVKRGMDRRSVEEVKHLGIDEKSFRKGQSYASLLYDLNASRVLEVVADRTAESATALLSTLPEQQRNEVAAVAVDMWVPFMTPVEATLPNAAIVHDKFHIVSYLTKMVDQVRRKENKTLRAAGINDLVGSRYTWLRNPDNWSEKDEATFYGLQSKGLKVARAWAIKETLLDLWTYSYDKPARAFFKKGYWWATHSRLKPVISVAKMLKKHLDNIMTYLKHRITNATAEGFNSKIQTIKSAARGFRNFENYRVSILFHCGKLNLYPQDSQ